MRLPLSWLKEFVDFKERPEKLAELLTLSGSEVEKIHHPVKLDKVVVGEIVSIEQHPNADRLKVVMVRTRQGSSDLVSEQTMRRIVCGAPNIKVGQKVAVALPGATLAGGVVLERKEVRGVVSDGMICAEDELGIGADHAGILVLPVDAEFGASVGSILGLDDTVFDLDITPNRGDCLSIRGLAREVAALLRTRLRKGTALTGTKLKNYGLRIADSKNKGQSSMTLQVRVEDKKACPLYFARLIEGVTVGTSPLQVQQRLASVGVRSINAAVDIANYVMMELGQPLHAFDASKIAREDGRIALSVRRAKRGERLELLDGKTYEFLPADIVISADGRVDDLAGVMGGQASGSSTSTTAIVLEAAIFDSVSIRRTYKRLGLRTEAAIRFEKRVDPAAVERALNRATALILEYCGGTVAQTVKVGAAPKPARPIAVSPERIAATIGAQISPTKQRQILTALGFTIRNAQFTVTIPSWRHDIEGEHDIVKEVGRMLPLNALVPTNLRAMVSAPPSRSAHVVERRLRRALLAYGFDEALLYSFYGASSVERMDMQIADHLTLANPLNPSQQFLRTSLLPNLLDAAAKNAGFGIEPNIFEIGTVFCKSEGRSGKPQVSGVREQLRVAAVARATPECVRALKGALAQCELEAEMRVLSRESAARWKLRTSIVYVEVALPSTADLGTRIARFEPLPAFPPVRRDLTIVLPTAVAYADVASYLKSREGINLHFELFEVFEGKPLPAGTKSLSFHLLYSAADRTLTADAVDRMHEQLHVALSKAFGAPPSSSASGEGLDAPF